MITCLFVLLKILVALMSRICTVSTLFFPACFMILIIISSFFLMIFYDIYCLSIHQYIRSHMQISYGGGVYVGGTNTNATFKNCTLKSNQALVQGGALFIYDNARLQLEDTVVDKNSAKQGGGLAVKLSQALIVKSNFTLNNASENGGGFYIYGLLTMMSSSIESNVAINKGGGLYITGDSKLTLRFN
mmetsp:Transcript_19406/g.23106  ORF Transcript_19406/g.23106 Transcript_19406/m.23106 type:complete len:188 (+) Transcript_19406:680-1243(+)